MSKPKKSKKGGPAKGHKAKKAKSSSAKPGAKRTSLRAGMIVTKKPNKVTLRNNKLKAKKVGMVDGKSAYKIMKSKRSAAKPTARSGYALAMRARNAQLAAAKKSESDMKKKVSSLNRLAKQMEKLGVAEEVRKVEAQLAAAQAELADLSVERAAKAAARAAALEEAREESRLARQAYED